MKKQVLFILLLAVGVIAAIVYFFNRGQNSLETSMAGQNPSPTIDNDCPFDQEFCAYTKAQVKALERGVVINTSTETPGYGFSTSQIKMDGAGNVSTDTYLEGELQSSMVIYAAQTYVKDLEDGTWYVISMDPNQAVTSEDDSNIPADLSSDFRQSYDQNTTMQANKVGTETCGELTCNKYQLVSSTEMANPDQTFIWIDTDEHLARKMEVISENGSFIMNYSYEEVSIARPEPLKDMPALTFPSSSGEDGEGQMPSEEEIETMINEYSLDR